MFTKRKLSLILFLCLTSILVITGCSKPQQSIIPTLEDNSASGALNYGEEEMLEVVSAQIDLEVGGVIEITDETSEIYGTRLVIDPIDKERSIKELGTAEIAIIIDQMVTATNKMVDSQGFLITPVGTKANIIDFLTGRLEIFYNRDKLSNSGVSKDSDVNVYRVLCTVDPTAAPVPVPVPFVSWEKVPVEKITHVENMVSIEIGIGDLLYLYALTVTNCIPPSNLGKPLPGDLVYRLSKRGVNDNWLPGHVGIYVGEKYHEKEGLYNVIEAIGISPNKVVRSYYSDITSFGSGPPTYMGAREPINQSLTHITRNRIVEYVEKMVGMPYAVVETFGVYFGWARGENVKGPGSYNCVGLAEAAYESVGIDIVSNKDEGNDLDPNHPDALLSPQEQLFSTVPASGVIDQNIAPEISSLAITPEGFIETNSLVYITCNASDSDQDELTYIWTIPIYGQAKSSTKGKIIIWSTPGQEGIYEISCKVIDNYGGEDSHSIEILVGDSIANQTPAITSTPVISATKGQIYSYDVNATDSDGDTLTYSLTSKPSGMTINSSTGLISWTPSTIGNYNVTVEVSDGNLFATQNFSIVVSEDSGTTTKPNPPTSLSPGSTSAPGPIISTLTPTLSWQSVSNADYYNLSVSIYPYGSSNIIFYNQQVYGNSITIPSGKLEEGQKYRWNIRAYNSAGYSDYSSDYYFQTESTQEVTLTLYLYENSLSGPPLSGVSVGVVDGGGTSSNHITNSSGYVTVKGIPGTWSFSAMKSGYDTNNWSQPITTNCTKYGYLVKSATPVGTIDVFATLDGSPWIGSLSYSLTGPSPSSGSTVPAVLNNKPIGAYSISYNSGGPSNAIVSSITPSSTQTLSTGSIIAFTFNFVSQAPSLGQAQLLSPSSGSSLPPMNVTFIWNSVSNATKYQFILYNSQGQVALDKIYTSTNAIVSLGTIETITWKVRAGDNSGNWGPWSSKWNLTIQ